MTQDRDNADATAAPATLELGGLGVLILRPLTPQDEAFIRAEYIRQCLPLLKSPLQQIADDVKGLPPALAAIAVRAAVEIQSGSFSGKGDPTEEMILSRLYHPDGVAFRIWIHARDAQPALKLAEVRAEITDANTVEVLANLAKAFGLVDDGAGDGEKKEASAAGPPEAGTSTPPASG